MIGPLVLYTWRPGQVRAGQSKSIALVTKENADKTVNLTVYPDGSPDALFLRGVPAFSQEISHHCFEELPSGKRIADLEARMAQLESDLIEAIEPKRKKTA